MAIDILLNTDISFYQGDLKKTEGLDTAYIISLLTNSGKYWGDAIETDGRLTGSNFYLLSNVVINDNTTELIRQYIETALQWLIDDGVVLSHEITIEREKNRINYNIVSTLSNDSVFKFSGAFE